MQFRHTSKLRNFREEQSEDALFIGSFEADLGVGGKVNLNRRIYPPQDFRKANEELNRRLQEGLVAPGEEGHPSLMDGPSFRIPVVLREVWTTEDAPGVIRSQGVFGITNTQSGRDVKTLHEIGVPIGVSSKMFARPEEHVLDQSSEFYAANREHEGAFVSVMRDIAFDEEGPYDLVRIPSAQTFVRSAESVEVREAWDRLTSEGVLQDPVSEPALPETQPQQETDMDLQEKIDALEAELKEVRTQGVDVQEVNTEMEDKVKTLTEANEALGVALEAAQNTANDLREQLSAAEKTASQDEDERLVSLRENAKADRERLVEAEAQLEETRAALETLRTERLAEKQAGELAKSVLENAQGDFEDLVKEELSNLIQGGVLSAPEKVGEHAERIRAICKRAAEKPAGEAKVVALDEEVDERIDDVPPLAVEGLGDEFVAHMNRLSAGLTQE